ncbi:roadblock/LC7 domain-containing protein [Nocardia sp. NPDC059239]|uniref:roadblock/LC7 domain-containing protein n=1 Tax=unclassified Nocardia TaxID=2637762 RepID=UPI003673797B
MKDTIVDKMNILGLDWLLEDLVKRLTCSEGAVVLSVDGLLLARTENLHRENGEHLAAMASALGSLARSVGTQFNKGALQQVVVELDEGYLVLTEAGAGACLALLVSATGDLGMVAYEMNMVVQQVGAYLSAGPRGAAEQQIHHMR